MTTPASSEITGTWRSVDGAWCVSLPRGAGAPGAVARVRTAGGRVSYQRLRGVVRVEPAGGPEIWSHEAATAADARVAAPVAPVAPVAPAAPAPAPAPAPVAPVAPVAPAAPAPAPAPAPVAVERPIEIDARPVVAAPAPAPAVVERPIEIDDARPVVAAPAPAPASAPAPAAIPVVTAVSSREIQPLGIQIEQISTRPSAPTPAERRAQAERLAEEARAARGAMAEGALVAGAAAEGHGCLVAWTGHGEITRARLVEILASAGAATWAPAPRSATAHAANAAAVLGTGYTVRPTPVPSVEYTDRHGRPARRHATVEERGWLSRWTVGEVRGEGQVGDAYGRIALVVTLTPTEQISVDGPEDQARTIRAEYARLVGAEAYRAADVTAWLRQRLHSAGAIRLGSLWYVPASARPVVEPVIAALSEAWGTAWTAPPIPVATSEQLRAGLARGLVEEAEEVLADLAAQRTAAREARRADVGTRAGDTLLRRLTEIGDRAAQYAALLGEAHVASVRARLRAAIAEVASVATEGAARAAQIELE